MFTQIAPVALFVFNRFEHTRQTVESLKQNKYAADTELIIFSDGARSGADSDSVGRVREYIDSIDGFKKVTVVKSDVNKGLATSILTGITQVLQTHDRIIVLEDDMLTSPAFLSFMNQGLEMYHDDEKVISVHGYVYPVKGSLPDTFFLKGAHCWGWGTWRRGWQLYERDSRKLLAQLTERNLQREFDYDGAYPFTRMLEDQIKGLNSSWGIRWHATAFLNDKLTLYPGRPFVRNIGFDDSGVHSAGFDRVYDVTLELKEPELKKINSREDQSARKLMSEFFYATRPTLMDRVILKLRRILK